jgi:hypothetical protein
MRLGTVQRRQVRPQVQQAVRSEQAQTGKVDEKDQRWEPGDAPGPGLCGPIRYQMAAPLRASAAPVTPREKKTRNT